MLDGTMDAPSQPVDRVRAFERCRLEMVRKQLVGRDISDPRVLQAFRKVPREAFLPPELHDAAYRDSPLPIGEGQTISQPYVVAHMIEALQLGPDARVLEIGAGSGYAAAILAEVAAEVYTIERRASLVGRARQALEQAGYESVHVIHGDGSLGYEPGAPYDGVIAAAAGPYVPESIKRQLAIGGRLVMPVGGTRDRQELVRVTRSGDLEFRSERLEAVRFVPLVGDEGWPAG